MKNILKCLIIIVTMAFTTAARAQVSIGVSIRVAPPRLPVYVQPACPVDGYLWQPGYWAYSPDDNDYYWVPGVWVAPPSYGVYWTPAYWGYDGGFYRFHSGYWGPHIGFYGGINYGYGYWGTGFVGGMWSGNTFRYNTAIVNVNRTVIHNTYINNTVINRTTNRVSFNGPGGMAARPSREEENAIHEHHYQPTADQQSHQQAARADKSQFSGFNHGRPVAAAMNTVHGNAYNPKGSMAPATPQQRQNMITNRNHDANQPRGAMNTNGQQADRPAHQQQMQQHQQNPQMQQQRQQEVQQHQQNPQMQQQRQQEVQQRQQQNQQRQQEMQQRQQQNQQRQQQAQQRQQQQHQQQRPPEHQRPF